ncbi:F0F1 ATP synthase subunit epsilon [Vreelandella titanicae]|jgi:F-type H+-transporting ATPase subunit epsilon|uniref:F0F1 ATP synthase subunit epsilon n=1 Tax=Halomonadaceae TaxID=28256 RepID=UPI00034BDF36|nr:MULTISPECIES: F0F1 ATP synthase subunit epsilon [Halomonas]NAO98248.1 F0F1 ATP synthase subunit epsilon [Halomonas sp. MG34]QGQ71136.1 F0F1 ATP synthase subunit epsilon [Halomonas sp. PA16-9]UEQ04250.1 F0F1 ATP synthase subunit epsilon [Halomonas profundus]KIN17089.1 ATP synthase F0F1 subunit epsilon [Halomonas sp. KHS3]MCD1585930.1 F0F1 ATP synthase subunit epsilon [Halomonas sp. IOP_14]|tara:strand:+ start:67 stop:495 length:429 start_codon:yes stop_codon:yes gene_type:complete
MANSFTCNIVSAEASIFSGTVEQVIASGIMGDLGVLPGHAPLLTELQPGPVRVIHDGGKEENFFVSGGFMEVQPNVVTILADSASRASDLNEAAAEEARQQALRAFNEKSSELDYTRAAAELAEAVAQLRTIQQLRKKAGKG